jgi:hypothetical protein
MPANAESGRGAAIAVDKGTLPAAVGFDVVTGLGAATRGTTAGLAALKGLAAGAGLTDAAGFRAGGLRSWKCGGGGGPNH